MLCFRLFKKLITKRPPHVTTDRLFLTPNPGWTSDSSKVWYKNCPVGPNEMSKWVKEAAASIGLNTKSNKISNHSLRSTAISHLAKRGVGEIQLTKISGHSSVTSIKPYVQLDSEHHLQIVEKLRGEGAGKEIQNNSEGKDDDGGVMVIDKSPAAEELPGPSAPQRQQNQQIFYQNCVFHCNSFNNN